MKKHQIMISSLAVLALSCNNALAEIASGTDCGNGCSWRISDDGILTVNGEDENSRMNDYTFTKGGNTASWGAYRDRINTVNVDIKNVGNYAFDKLEAVQTLKIGDSVTNIGKNAFSGISYIQSLTIGNNVTNIENTAFTGMWNPTSLTIPDSVTSIGDYAFSGMSESAQIYCKGSIRDMLEANRYLYGLDSQTLIPYTKDKDGVYNVDGVFYSSSENMQVGISCGSQAACAEEIKNAKQTQTSSGEETHIVRRIYTVEEATEAVSGKGKNTFTIRYR